jgi:hypothetical protein
VTATNAVSQTSQHLDSRPQRRASVRSSGWVLGPSSDAWSDAPFDWPSGLGGEAELAVAVGFDVEELAVDEVVTADAEPDHVVEVGVASA